MNNLSNQQFDTYYHRTDPESAGHIIKGKKIKASYPEDMVFVSNKLEGGAKEYGRSVVEVQVPKKARGVNVSSNPEVHEDEVWWGFAPKDVKVTRAWSEL